jgi:hypothetical protein
MPDIVWIKEFGILPDDTLGKGKQQISVILEEFGVAAHIFERQDGSGDGNQPRMSNHVVASIIVVCGTRTVFFQTKHEKATTVLL